jgi:hypothetical protein
LHSNLTFKEQEGTYIVLARIRTGPHAGSSPVDTDTLCFCNIHFYAVLHLRLFSMCFFPVLLFDFNFVRLSHFSHACYMRRPSHSPGFLHFTSICGSVLSKLVLGLSLLIFLQPVSSTSYAIGPQNSLLKRSQSRVLLPLSQWFPNVPYRGPLKLAKISSRLPFQRLFVIF